MAMMSNAPRSDCSLASSYEVTTASTWSGGRPAFVTLDSTADAGTTGMPVAVAAVSAA